MREQDYIDITDLAKLRLAYMIFYDCLNSKTDDLAVKTYELIRELEIKTKNIILEE